jgi:penicillin-binding protein 1A
MAKKKYSEADLKNYFSDYKKRNGGKSFLSGNKKNVKLAAIIAGVLFIGFVIYIYIGLPSLEELENPKPQLASKVYTVDGELLGQFFIENRIETHIDSLPHYLVDALVSTEDRRFYDHWGVDVQRFGKAMIKNVFTFSREGASTITQQLAKNLYDLKSKNESSVGTVIRKMREWITAIQIEKNFTKREILEMYLNVSYFGRSAYGIESAAKVFFDKKASELTLPEAALCVALLKSSENYDPIRRKDNALQRRNLVMYNMVDNGMLSEARYNQLKNEPIVLSSKKISGSKSIAPHFMEYVRKQMEVLARKHGYDLYRDGLNIYTSLDYRMQRIANQAAAEHLKEYQPLFNKNWKWENNQDLLASLLDKAIKQNPEYRGASSFSERDRIYNRLKYDPAFVDSVKADGEKIEVGFVAIDPTNGQIRAMVGGENQDFGRGLNHVTGIKRQPGSSFKPIVYTTAIDNGYGPATTLLNQRFNYNGWSPANSNGDYGGYITLRQGLINSVNVISGRMTTSQMAPPSQVAKYAKKLGINSEISRYPSIALGTSEVTPLEITSAYATLANKGVHIEPIAILKIEDRNGILIDQFSPETSEAVSPETASIITDMMQDVVNYGTGAGVRRYFHRPAAGKTGTTQNFSDAWFIGFTPQLVAGVWVGFDDHRVKFTNWYGQGAKAALPIWAKFMDGVYREVNLPLKYFELAPGVTYATFCREGMDQGETRIATAGCPDVYNDIVDSRHMPGECEIHGGGPRSKPEEKQGDTGW